ncbi:MAG: amino acid permease [Methylocapsa sp.]|nr:amino acid permease [Methylocapsa sp.]
MFKFVALGKTASLSNLWTHGSFFPFGLLGVLLPLQMVMFAYQGLELIGPSAALYIGALLRIMSLMAWNQLSPSTSPFVLVFEKLRVPAGADIVNFVVITAPRPSRRCLSCPP